MKESIVLPLPNTLVDKYGIEYNSNNLGTKGAGIASIAQDVIDSFQKAGTAAGEQKEAGRKDSKTAQQAGEQKKNAVFTTVRLRFFYSYFFRRKVRLLLLLKKKYDKKL